MTTLVEQLITEGRAALRAGDAAGARAVFEHAFAESASGDVIEGLARASISTSTIEVRYNGSATAREAPASVAATATASSTTEATVDTLRASRRQNGVCGSARRPLSGCAR